MNPSAWRPVHEMLGDVPNVTLTPPLEYLPLVHLIRRAYLVLTDSGGLQEEVPSPGVPVLRDVTERPEAVHSGSVHLVGTAQRHIVEQTERLLCNPQTHAYKAQSHDPYGDGYAAPCIVAALLGEPASPFGD